ncbi:26S proteasome subunit RPN7-domain-containing protein [Leucosporidium creatinivorum]|uniref:26S proteasome subunit RPN7-domain-containing protein n=1 Tax=Leucosporidium creatinivorum TaxID=106004 RepID=A0A1Y2FFG4_9BASI|nr:26S proteasome subunit RPN7-domain-containing protein [Leucosporidium creatinivorum]
MEVDTPTEAQVARPATRIVRVEPDSPFELDQVANSYEGRSKINRLLYIANSAPALAGPALTQALSTIKETTLDVSLYEQAFHLYRQTISAIQAGENTSPLAVAWYESVKGNEVGLDRVWMEAARKEGQSTMDKLEVELKGYSTNLIKESIRMGHRDLARHQYKMGDLQGAIRSYTKSREFCTTSQHVLEMCMGVIEVALEMANYSFVRNYVVKAESALEALNAPAAGAKAKQPVVALPGMVAPAADPVEVAKEKERQSTHERLTVAQGVASLGTGSFERAARAFTGIGKEALESKDGHFIPPADIALYAALTGLATFNRNELKTRLLENADLRPMLDQEPYLRDIIRAFQSNNFKEGLRGLEQHSNRQELDPHLAPHLHALYHMIRSRALLSYFTPFATVSITRMAEAFGWAEDYLLVQVTDLIGRGEMKARVDSQARVLVAKKKDVRQEAFKHALEEGERIQRRALASQLRLKLIQADILVKPPKSSGGQQQQEAF